MIKVFHATVSEEAIAVATKCMREGWIGYGPRCLSLEQHFMQQHEGWALATSSCTTALYLSALLLEPRPGDEVIVPATTFVSTAMAFRMAGWQIRTADVEPATLMVSPRTIADVATPRTRAVVAVHLYGQRAPTADLGNFCAGRGYSLIEDCAHRLPMPGDGARHGTFACYSFNAVKEAPCGEGGLLWCVDPALESSARQLSNLGLLLDTPQRCAATLHSDYVFGKMGGLKLRLNDIGAALALHGISTLSESRNRRREIAAHYHAELADLHPLIVPISRGIDDSCLMYVVRIQRGAREQLRHSLSAAGISTSVHYPSLSLHPMFAATSCPISELAGNEVVTLPLHLDLTNAEVALVIDAIRGWTLDVGGSL